MSSSRFKIDNKELLRALGIAQTTRGRDHNNWSGQQDIVFQESDSTFEMTKKYNDLTEDRGQFLFALDIDISDNQKDSLAVYSKDKPYDLARSFCQKHEIENEIAEIIASQIVENAKLALINKEDSFNEAHLPEIFSQNEDFMTSNNNWMQPKGGDDSVEEVLSRSNTDDKTFFMSEMNIAAESGVKRKFHTKNEQDGDSFASGDDMTSRFNDSTKETKKSNSFVAPVFTENNFSLAKSQSKNIISDRFYDKALRDIENRTRNEAYIVEIYNQEKYKECTFHPSINATSLKLATNRKRDLSTEHLLLLKGKITEERKVMIKQNLRLKENKNNTFKPEINNKSKYLGEKKRQSSETNERFEDLYQEYKIISEKRNQLRLKLDKQYSFAPNLCQNRKIQDSSNFLERLTEDIKKRQAKRSSEEENQYEPLPTFCPQITKNIVDSSRNIDKLPIGEYLYKMSNQMKERQTDLREAADKELKAKAPKCTEKSAQIIRMKIKNNLEHIFESLDTDKVGFISAEHLKHVPKEIIKILGPLFEEFKQTNSRIDLQQFTIQCEKLLKVADPTIKSYLMTDLPKQASKENNKFYQELELAFHPNINKKSKEIADAEEERQGRSVYQRLYSERAKSEMRLRELKEKSATNELRECSFQPVINKYSGCTEAFYQKIFSQAQEN